MRPNAKNDAIPLRPDGTRDVDLTRKVADTWKDMEKLVQKGKVKSIGLSNASQKVVETVLPIATILPAVDQVRLDTFSVTCRSILTAIFSSNSICTTPNSSLSSGSNQRTSPHKRILLLDPPDHRY